MLGLLLARLVGQVEVALAALLPAGADERGGGAEGARGGGRLLREGAGAISIVGVDVDLDALRRGELIVLLDELMRRLDEALLEVLMGGLPDQEVLAAAASPDEQAPWITLPVASVTRQPEV